jgi:flagellar basal body-associated protein FliL
MPPLLLIAIAMAAAFAALALVFWAVSSAQEAEKKKAEQQRLALEGTKDATEDLATKANEAREAYKKLLEQKDTHNNLKDELDSLV